MLYLALREAARIRLFTHSPWLTDDLFNAVVHPRPIFGWT